LTLLVIQEKQTNSEILHHNFTPRISTGVFDSKTLSSIYKLSTLGSNLPKLYPSKFSHAQKSVKNGIFITYYHESGVELSHLTVHYHKPYVISYNAQPPIVIYGHGNFVNNIIKYSGTSLRQTDTIGEVNLNMSLYQQVVFKCYSNIFWDLCPLYKGCS